MKRDGGHGLVGQRPLGELDDGQGLGFGCRRRTDVGSVRVKWVERFENRKCQVAVLVSVDEYFFICPLSPFLPTLKKGIQPVPTMITE